MVEEVTKEIICHICGTETEFTCEECGEPVCEDCCTPMTIHNQIDYPLCITCNLGRESAHYREVRRREREEEVLRLAKITKNAAAKARYWKPENVAKREAAKIERKRVEAELRKKQAREASEIVGSMFRGMFR